MVQVCGENDKIWYDHVFEGNKDTKVCMKYYFAGILEVRKDKPKETV